MKIHSGVKWFLDHDDFCYINNDNSYIKSIISDDLIILTCIKNEIGDFKTFFNQEKYIFLGIYSKKKGQFVLLNPELNLLKEVILDDYNKYYYLTNSYIKNNFENMIVHELNEIFKNKQSNQQSKSYQDEIHRLAISHLRKKISPNFKENLFEIRITPETAENILNNTEDYAFELAEDLLLNKKDLVEDYIKKLDIKEKMEELKLNPSKNYQFESDLFGLQSKYKTITVYLQKDNDEIILKNYKSCDLYKLPIFFINKIEWKTKVIFDKNNYDINIINHYQTSTLENIQYLKDFIFSKVSFDEYSMFLNDYILNNYIIMKEVVIRSIRSYEYIGEKLRNDISFATDIFNLNNSSGLFYLILYSKEDVWYHYLDEFCNYIKDNTYIINKLDKDIASKPNIFYHLLDTIEMPALQYYTEDLKKDYNIRFKVEQLCKNNKLSFTTFSFSTENLPLELFDDEDILINLTTKFNIKNLDNSYKSNKNFVLKLLDKIKSFNAKSNGSSVSFDTLWNLFPNFQNDLDVCIEMGLIGDIENEKLFLNLAPHIKLNSCFQLTQKTNKFILKYLDEDIKRIAISLNIQLFSHCYDITKCTMKEFRYLASSSITQSFLANADYSNSFDIFNNLSKKIDIKYLIEMILINPTIYSYIDADLAEDYNLAYELTRHISIIPYMDNYNLSKYSCKNKLFENEEIMLRSIQKEPDTFQCIPTKVYANGKIKTLSNKTIVKEAIVLDNSNIHYCDKSLLNDKDLLKNIITDDRFDYTNKSYLSNIVGNFKKQFYKEEDFVYELLDILLFKHKGKSDYNDMISTLNCILIPKIPHKIKDTNKFKSMYPMFV